MNPLQRMERMEQMELELTQWNAKRALSPIEKRLEVKRVGHATLLRDQTAPISMYYNRVKGFGPDELPLLGEILDYYGDFAPCFDLTPDRMTEEVTRALSEKSFVPVEQLAFLAVQPGSRDLDTAQPPFQIERVTEESAEEFIEWIVLSSNGGIKITDAMIARTRSYFHAPHFINYMLRIDGEPAAMSSLFVHGQEGYLANDFTFEAYRGRGCQTALIERRLGDAARLGLTDVYTDVRYGSVSHGNMEKAGFRTAFLNTFWMKN
ncbi:N-acetyltransferase [Paenibacillus nanensis]|uniref:N-acetyltransferase n=1 Tax=Paenibacillus nanensis TaxID=393251 RepID=A0A3A1V1H9_9BACL|nr:GNAT family N-acetyltransferase [Paenibacillus nanensis]RIX51440.1 N-acetyltransferase [Paenibacillus nanensis]